VRRHASEDSIVASKSLARCLARLIQPNVHSTTPRLGNTMKHFICCHCVDDVTEIRLAKKAARWASSPL